MDYSKLPKFSQTPPPPAAHDHPAGPVAAPEFAPARPAQPISTVHVGAEAWISLAIGLIVLLVFRRLIQYLLHILFGTFFAPYTMPDGTQVSYLSTLDFWSDLGITLFGVILVLDGIVLLARSRFLLWITFVLTALTVLYNLGYLIATINRGLPIVSLCAVAIGGYIGMYQWRFLQESAPRR